MATYFMDLALENVKCFKERQVLDLSNGNGKPARWTIILGENGTGKTTVLKALGTLDMEFIFDENYDFPYRNADLFEYLGEAKIEAVNIYVGQLKGNGRLSKGLGMEKVFIRMANQNHSLHNIIITNGENYDELNALTVYAYGAPRRMGNGSLTESRKPDPQATLFSDKATLLNAEAWLLETNFAIANSKGEIKQYLQKRYELIKETLKNLLPDILNFRIKEITKTQTQAAIEVQTPYGWVAMKELSYGYLTFIGWVVDLAARMFERYPSSDHPLSEPAIVLVDEIDLHLHPKWQRQIIEFLTKTFTETQFIVTAHSPLIVQAAEGANLVLLKREGDSVKIYNDMEREAITGWRVDQVLASDLFGLESTRPPAYDKSVTRQKELLEKDVLTPQDEAELEALGKELEEMSLTNDVSPETVKFMQRALKILQTDDKN